jgi:uncharacterized protein HemX
MTIAAIIAFFKSPLGGIAGWAILIAVIVASAFTALYLHDRKIRAEATAEFNAEQLAIVLKEKQELQKDLSELKVYADQQTAELDKSAKQLTATQGEIQKMIDASVDRPSSDVLKNTIRALQKVK